MSMIVVSGCPRSGTSLMMQVLRAALGEDRVIGERWPASLSKVPPLVANQIKALNPGGFWECEATLHGLRPRPRKVPPEGAIADVDHGKAIKIVATGLGFTKPAHISHLLYMERHPWAQASSGSKSIADMQTGETVGQRGEAGPETYIEATAMAAKYIAMHRIPTMVVSLEQLTANAPYLMGMICGFLGFPDGDWGAGWALVDRGRALDPPPPPTDEGPGWGLSIRMHECVLSEDWAGVLDLYRKETGRDA